MDLDAAIKSAEAKYRAACAGYDHLLRCALLDDLADLLAEAPITEHVALRAEVHGDMDALDAHSPY